MAELGPTLQAALQGRYNIEREIGRGGMALVFLADDLRHHRPVAIKVLKPEIATSIGAERFLREIETAARLTHPYILPLYDSGDADGLLYYVMPFVEGETLRDRLDRERQLSIPEAIKIATGVASALSHAHSLGIIHRDIKPENIMFEGGEAVVTDFGIARALDTAGGDRLTETGLTLGTLAYMSPEQAAGDRKLDGRSDQYALACMLHEMLTGEQPFTGPTAQSIIAKHISEQPPSIRVVRPRVPIAMEAAVRTALSKIPADRYPSVTEFADALTSGTASQPLPEPEAILAPKPSPSPWRRRWVVAVPVLVAAAAAMVLVPKLFFGSSLNPSQYVIATLDPDPDSQAQLRWEIELGSALGQMPELVLTEDHRVNDRILQLGGPPPTVEGWLGIARTLGAGRLLVSRLVSLGDSTEILTDEYDVGRRRASQNQRVRVASANMGDGAARMVEQLFNVGRGVISSLGSSNADAVRQYVAGHEALKSWDLRGAEQHFAEAIKQDPTDPQAHLWLSKVKLWAGDPVEEWGASARRAAASLDRLRDDRERQRALALRELSEERYPEACQRYAALVAVDSASFEGWFGLGECHRRDRAVAANPSSPSGWSFRSSYHRAIQAYQRALEQVPSFAFQFGPFERLDEVLIVSPGHLRPGHADDARGTGPTLFAAFPSIANDTLAFVPFRLASVQAGEPRTIPATQRQAIALNRERLLQIVRNWTAAFPDSARANLALGRALELNGWLDGGGTVDRSALAAVQKARQVSRTRKDSVEAGLIEARVLLKLERFQEVRAIADRFLDRTRGLEPGEARDLIGLAALTGRPSVAAALGKAGARVLAEAPSGPYRMIALPVLETWQAFMAYASIGSPLDSITALATRLDTLLQVYPAPTNLGGFVECDISWYPRSLAFTELRQVTERRDCWDTNALLGMQWAANQNSPEEVGRQFSEVQGGRGDFTEGEVSFEHPYNEARVLLQVGDTARATQHLSRALAAIRALRTSVITEPPQAASLVRAMALRAELAAKAGETVTARLWAERVIALWRDGEPAVESTLVRMQQLAAR